jgi:hypothetical protein
MYFLRKFISNVDKFEILEKKKTKCARRSQQQKREMGRAISAEFNLRRRRFFYLDL